MLLLLFICDKIISLYKNNKGAILYGKRHI